VRGRGGPQRESATGEDEVGGSKVRGEGCQPLSGTCSAQCHTEPRGAAMAFSTIHYAANTAAQAVYCACAAASVAALAGSTSLMATGRHPRCCSPVWSTSSPLPLWRDQHTAAPDALGHQPMLAGSSQLQ